MRELERVKAEYGEDRAARKLALLADLDRARLAHASAVLRLHEALCFLRAYPDDRAVLERVEGMLERFERRKDLRRHRSALADSGIAGTEIRFQFFAPTARWLARRFPERLSIEWGRFENKALLERLLDLIALYSETPGLDEADLGPRAWVRRLKGPRETDATFLIRRFDAVRAAAFVRDRLYEELDVPIRLAPGPGHPSRTRARFSASPVHFQTRPLRRERPDLAREVRRPPLSMRAVPEAQGRELVDLACEAMITRSRDLDAFMHGDPRDVRLVDCGEGLQFACIGVVPERRLLLEAVYGFLTLESGVPIGYVLASALFRSSEIAYNVFESFRGAEAAHVYGRVLAMTRALFGADTFTVYPYQLGHENEEGLRSGAWWFYQKLGFRARAPEVLRIMRLELAAMRRNPSHRSSLATLRILAAENVTWSLGRPRDDVIGVFPLDRVGLAITDYVAGRFGSDRERAERICAEEAARSLGFAGWKRLPAPERLAWERWSPLVRILPGIRRWGRAHRAALARVVRAKGGRRESDFVRLLDRHAPLRRALVALAGPEASAR